LILPHQGVVYCLDDQFVFAPLLRCHRAPTASSESLPRVRPGSKGDTEGRDAIR
jgi:hypothetical protein